MAFERPAIWECLAGMTAISVDHVGKTFRLHHLEPTSLRDRVRSRFTRSRLTDEAFWALRDVSFDVPYGEMFGLIGANGSGKSTLLQVVAGIHAPDMGSVAVSGRLRALLELGTGFNDELTGRQNVFLNASLHGFSRAEVQRRFDEIVGFAELERFIDMPLKTYSSGMQVRLGFSTVAHLDPEVLLLDEVLAVGDATFQRKCLQRIREIRRGGAAILFISHDLISVEQLCDRAGLLDHGTLTDIGTPTDIVSRYRASLANLSREPGDRSSQSSGTRWGSGEATIDRVSLIGDGDAKHAFRTHEPLTIAVEFTTTQPLREPAFGLAIRTDDGTLVSGPNTKMGGFRIDTLDGRGRVEYRIPHLPLLPGGYVVSASIYDTDLVEAYDHWQDCADFVVLEDGTPERFGVIAMASLGAEWHLQRATDASSSPAPKDPR